MNSRCRVTGTGQTEAYESMTDQMNQEAKRRALVPDKGTDAGAGVEPKVRAHLGVQLRRLYDGILSEPVPDRFSRLLDELDKKESVTDSGEGS